MNAIHLAALAAAGFTGASLLALFGKELGAKGRSYSAAFAAGILLSLGFVDLFPEALETAGEPALVGFIGGFTLLYLTEAFTHAHAHHPSTEHLHKRTLRSFVLGLAVHNLSDGFVLGVGVKSSAVTSWLVGFGIFVHQMPVGISLAAVFIAARAARDRVVRTAVLLGLAIPFAASLTEALPVPGEGTLGFLTGIAGGILVYIGAGHLLPEAQAEHPGKLTGVVFATTFIFTSVGIMTVLGN